MKTETKRLFPITITTKMAECKQFYTKWFDFEVVFEADWYIHLKHESGIEIAVMLPDLPNQPSMLHAPYSGNGVVYSFEVRDAEKEYKRLTDVGIAAIFDLKVEEWGQKHFMVKDPAGMILDIVEHL